MQTYKLEWNIDTGARRLVARVFVQGRRTSAYLPVPEGGWNNNVPFSVWQEAQEMYEYDNEVPF